MLWWWHSFIHLFVLFIQFANKCIAKSDYTIRCTNDAAQMLNNLVFSINIMHAGCVLLLPQSGAWLNWVSTWMSSKVYAEAMIASAIPKILNHGLKANIYDLCVYRMSEQKPCVCQCMCDWRSAVKGKRHSVTLILWHQIENRREMMCVNVKKGRRIAVHSC